MPATPTSTPSGPTPGSIEVRISEVKVKILESEVNLIKEMAKVAPHRIGDTEWLKAAAEKECCAAEVLKSPKHLPHPLCILLIGCTNKEGLFSPAIRTFSYFI